MGMTTNDLDTVLNDIILKMKPSNEVITYDVKPLARIVAHHNRPATLGIYDPLMPLRGPGASPTSQFEDDFEVQPSDIDYAHDIAEYYKNKLVTRALTQSDSTKRSRSTFDRDLGCALKLNDEYTSKEEYFPILYRLPDFYIEDQIIDELVQQHVSHDSPYWSMVGGVMVVGELRFVRKVVVKKRAYNITAYYFADNKNQLVRIPVPKDCVIMPLMGLLEQAKSFIMLGNTISRPLHRDHRDFEVLEPEGTKWNITDLEM